MNKSERCHTENHDVGPFEGSCDCVLGKLVRPERFELPTYSSGGCRSIQLSYGRAADSSSVHGRRGRLNDCGEAGIPVETRLDASLACSIAGDGASPVSTDPSTTVSLRRG